jgi:hypothetical protein
MRVATIIISILVGLFLIGWIGFKIEPSAFPQVPEASQDRGSIPLPTGLPAPVERFYRSLYGDRIPVIDSAVITGKAELRPYGNLTLPGRFRFIHDAGRGYRHYIEAMFWGLPVMQVNERYLDGKALGELPFGIVSQGEKVDQAANLGMWAELAWVPSVFLTDSRVHWEAVDEQSAVLVVPFEDGVDHFLVRFDPQTDRLRYMEAMRYKDQSSLAKSLWITESLEYQPLNGIPVAVKGTATWFEDGKAWATFIIQDLKINVDVHETVKGRGY